ncbi:MAG: cell division protein FtsL [Pseudomonadota bacterium]
MKTLVYTVAIGSVIGVAYWAYQENFRTQQAQDRVRDLQAQIADTREALSVQLAEWAYLNRPERLRELAEMNFDRLGLLPLTPSHFGEVDQVAYPPRDPISSGLAETVELSGGAE